MTTTQTRTRTKTGKSRRVLKRLMDSTEETKSGDTQGDEYDEHDEHDDHEDDNDGDYNEHDNQRERDADEGREKTVTLEQREEHHDPREADPEESTTTDRPTNEDEQRAERVVRVQPAQQGTETTPGSNNTMDAATMAAAIQQLTTAVTGLQAASPTARSGRRRSSSSRRRTETRDHGRPSRTGQRRVAVQPAVQAEPAVRAAPTTRATATGGSAATTQAASLSEMTAMTAAIGELTAMVANLQPTEANTSRHGRQSRRRTARRGTTGRGSTPDPSDSSSSSDESRDGGRRRHTRRHHDEDGDGDSSSSSSSSNSSSSSSDDGSPSGSSGESESDERRKRHHGRRGRRKEKPVRRSVKDLELPTFSPSPRVSVSTWIDRVDLAIKGAAMSGRGKWSDHALYFILGNKLMEEAAKWWVNQDRRLKKKQRTWTYLKKALLRRYGPKLDKSNAELRVTMRRLMPGETYADFASALREIVGRNRVKERVLLAQFLRCLDKTTKKLVLQRPKPKTLEEAVDKATEIDDPMDNVALGMVNIGQPWAVAPSPHLMTMTGTTGPLNVIPGISGTGLPAEIASAVEASNGEPSGVALFTNPQGVWNECSGTWDPLPGHVWNGKFWAETKKREVRRAAARTKADGKKPAVKTKTKREDIASSGEESDVRPKRKKFKAAVRQAAADTKWCGTGRTNGGKRQESDEKGPNDACFKCGKSGHWSSFCTVKPTCFACGQAGHFARECTDADAKARNDAYLVQREKKSPTSAENMRRAQ